VEKGGKMWQCLAPQRQSLWTFLKGGKRWKKVAMFGSTFFKGGIIFSFYYINGKTS
jgi:hypothetical protein